MHMVLDGFCLAPYTKITSNSLLAKKTMKENINNFTSSDRQAVLRELDSGEIIKWSGHPNPKAHMIRSLGIFLFAIPWTAFSLFWIAGAAGFKIPDFSDVFDFFPLFGIPFLLVGVGMLSSPYLAYRSAKRTIYVITNKRAFELKIGTTKEIKNYSHEAIEEINKTEKADGSGNVLFSSESRRNKHGSHSVKIGFIGVDDVRSVELHIRALREQKS